MPWLPYVGARASDNDDVEFLRIQIVRPSLLAMR
jgi:hypothetical protein